jgi:hypothetical protein
MQRGGGQALKRAHIGAILVEFALAVPVLIAIIYYLHDLPKYKRMQAKMLFCAHEMVNILQNVSQNRANKKVTTDDIKYAMTSSFLTIFPGITQYSDKGTGNPACAFPLGYFPVIWIYCVIGNSDGTASVAWVNHACIDYYSAGGRGLQTPSSHNGSTVKYFKNKNPSSIYPTLRIGSGEIKIICECSLCYHYLSGGNWIFSNGNPVRQVLVRDAFGFYLLSPKSITARREDFFSTVIIFTPNPGLFDETLPS